MNEAYRKSDGALTNEALRLARDALQVDPESVLALNVLGFSQFHNLLIRTTENRAQAWLEGMEAASQGIALEQSSLSYALKALLIAHEPTGGKLDEARAAGATAYRLNPHESAVITIYAQTLIFTGDPVQAIQLLKRALRINPRDPRIYNVYSELAQAHVVAADYAGAMEWAVHARSEAPGYVHTHLLVAMVHVGLGDIGKAKASLEEARRLAPDLVRRRLQPKPPGRGIATGHQFDILLKIAAGLEDPSAANCFRAVKDV